MRTFRRFRAYMNERVDPEYFTIGWALVVFAALMQINSALGNV